jgi:biopolymer transport protein ExbB
MLTPLWFRRLAWLLVLTLLCGAPLAAQEPLATNPPGVTQDAPALPATEAGLPAVPAIAMARDLTPLGMVRAAHPVVQAVMALLAGATLLCWTVLVFKTFEIGLLRRRTRRSCGALHEAATLGGAATALAAAGDPAAAMALTAWDEVQRSGPALDQAGPVGLKERVRSLLDRLELRVAGHLRRGTGLLATIGATAPFVGLFGTVWGIMNAFVGISASGTTNLAVVAPGIAEALLATAIGLVAAIPAVVIYNHFSRSIASYRLLLGDAAAAIERLVSRDLDFRPSGESEG